MKNHQITLRLLFPISQPIPTLKRFNCGTINDIYFFNNKRAYFTYTLKVWPVEELSCVINFFIEF